MLEPSVGRLGDWFQEPKDWGHPHHIHHAELLSAILSYILTIIIYRGYCQPPTGYRILNFLAGMLKCVYWILFR